MAHGNVSTANKPFIPGYGEKPAGANFYPEDMTKEEFEKWNNHDKTNQYTLVRTTGRYIPEYHLVS